MKKILQASLSAVLVLSLVGCGSTKDEAIYQDSIDAYVNEIDMDYAYDFTKTLSTDTSLHDISLGFRTSGSDAEHRTANYLAKEMKAIGLKNVEKIPVNVDKWQYNDASLTIEGTDIDMMPVSYMVNGTDENGITAQIVDCGTGFAKDYEGKDASRPAGRTRAPPTRQRNPWQRIWVCRLLCLYRGRLYRPSALSTAQRTGTGCK